MLHVKDSGDHNGTKRGEGWHAGLGLVSVPCLGTVHHIELGLVALQLDIGF